MHCGASMSTQSWYFVEYFWHVPPACGLILQLLCGSIGNRNFRKKRKENITTEWTPHSVLFCNYQSEFHHLIRCLHQYKDDLRRKAEESRRSEARRRKEAQAMQSSSDSSAVSASVLAIVAAVIASSKISWWSNDNETRFDWIMARWVWQRVREREEIVEVWASLKVWKQFRKRDKMLQAHFY